jgi:hypothetical protein
MEITPIDSTLNSELFIKQISFFRLRFRFIPRYKPVGAMLLTSEHEKEAIKYLNTGILGYYCIYLTILLGIYLACIGHLIGGYFLYIQDDKVGYGICIGIFVTTFLLGARSNLIKKNVLSRGLGNIRLVVNFINSEILKESEVKLGEPESVFEIPLEENGTLRDIVINKN